MWTPGIGELVIIFLIVLVLFGGGKLAGVGKSLGTAISEFKSALTDEKKDPKEASSEEPPKA
jgi:sec-independent protein translocase protein TatA